MKKLGAHVGIGKGLVAALEKAREMGANTIQIFSSPPLAFAGPKFSDDECSSFKTKAGEMGIAPVFIHACYLVNLASEKANLQNLSIQSLVEDLNFGDKIGALGVIVHTGSHKGKGFESVLPKVTEAIKTIFARTRGTTKLLLEVASGGAGKIGSTFLELAQICKLVNSPRIGVCLDTAHLFAAGYEFDSPEKIVGLSQEIAGSVGWDDVKCLHINDSKVPLGSFRDRHENLGQGLIGLGALRLLLNYRHFDKLPLILETPGFTNKGPDQKNLEILKTLAT